MGLECGLMAALGRASGVAGVSVDISAFVCERVTRLLGGLLIAFDGPLQLRPCTDPAAREDTSHNLL